MSFFMPEAASTGAVEVDKIFFGLLVLAILIVLLVFALITTFAIRYRRGSGAIRGRLPDLLSREFEVGWVFATVLLFVFVFWWAASADLSALQPTKEGMEIHVVAKQWMWKAEHPTGAREIDALHVPVDTPIRLSLESQDVIHSFFVPAFRIKQDVVPGTTTHAWFQATETGDFQLFCAEFCGTSHSAMLGRVVVMRQSDYASWLTAQPAGDDLAHRGSALFVSAGCSGCHAAASKVDAPKLVGLIGRPVPLADGRTIVADDEYVRDSILHPKRDVTAGYPATMPSYAGLLDDGDIQSLTAYLRSLAAPGDGKP